MDPLSDLLTQFEFGGSLYFSTEFTPPFAIRVPRHPGVVRFHLVTRGSCVIRVEGADEGIRLEAGDFALVPHGASHDLADDPHRQPRALETVLEDAGYDGNGHLIYGLSDRGQTSRMLCGHFSFRSAPPRGGFLAELPTVIVARGLPARTAEWVRQTLELVEDYKEREAPGKQAILIRVAEILFVEGLRAWLAEGQTRPGVLRALRDPQLAQAITAVHQDPRQRWTVEGLAREAALSRTIFAERFAETVGTTPLQYVTELRLIRARGLLRDQRVSVDAAAAEVGYASGAAFSRAYSRFFGEGPGQARRG